MSSRKSVVATMAVLLSAGAYAGTFTVPNRPVAEYNQVDDAVKVTISETERIESKVTVVRPGVLKLNSDKSVASLSGLVLRIDDTWQPPNTSGPPARYVAEIRIADHHIAHTSGVGYSEFNAPGSIIQTVIYADGRVKTRQFRIESLSIWFALYDPPFMGALIQPFGPYDQNDPWPVNAFSMYLSGHLLK